MVQYYSTPCLLFFLSLYNSLDTIFTQCNNFVGKLYMGIRDAFTEKLYYLLENVTIPLPVKSINISASSSAVPDWYYSLDKKQFIQWKFSTPISVLLSYYNAYYLPILSMEILEEDSVIYDLTDFIGDIKVHTSGAVVFPSIAHILGAWSLSSGIILDATREFNVRIIDIDGNTVLFPTDSYEYFEALDNELESEVIDETLDVSGNVDVSELVPELVPEPEPEVKADLELVPEPEVKAELEPEVTT